MTIDALPELDESPELDSVAAYDLDFELIPAADRDAEIDQHWLELRGDSLLPTLYMPATMPGQRSTLMRVVASGLIGVFMLATSLGICLTYGPPTWP